MPINLETRNKPTTQRQQIARMLKARKTKRGKNPFRPAEVCPTCHFRIRGPNHATGTHHLLLNRLEILSDRRTKRIHQQAGADNRRGQNS